MRFMFAAGLVLGLAAPVAAQQFTTVAEVKPILQLTKSSWVMVREYDDKDLLYFTHLASFRCALSEIRFGINTDFAALPFQPEPCYSEESSPNALKMENGALPFVTFPLGTVQSVTVVITYIDGSEDTASYERAAIMPN